MPEILAYLDIALCAPHPKSYPLPSPYTWPLLPLLQGGEVPRREEHGLGRSGTALPATRWARLRAHRIALNLDSSVPRRFSPAAYRSWTDRGEDGHAMQAHPRHHVQVTYGSWAETPGPAGPEGKGIGLVPLLCSVSCAEPDTICTYLPRQHMDPEAGELRPGEPRLTGATRGQTLL